VAHVGDSRAYRIRDGQIEQLSFDHSMVWEYARKQHMDPTQVQGIPSNVIFRSLGPEPLVPVDIEGVHPLRDGDIFLLCSDGLSGQVTDMEMGAVASVLPPEPACRFLVDLANHRGGPDNITVIIVRIGRKLATPPPVKRAWYHRVPWSLVALFLGVVLSGGAVALALYPMLLLAGLAFGLAVVTLLAGVIGLVVYHAREKKRATEEADRPQPKIHRNQDCRIDRLLVEKMARIVQDLKQSAQDKTCEIDSKVFEAFLETAQIQGKAGNMVAAFREYCLASQVLMTTLKTQQAKTEVFQPNWDKREVPRLAPGGGNGRDREVYRCEQCGKVKGPSGDWKTPVCCERRMTKLP
jgi:protein phosphatase